MALKISYFILFGIITIINGKPYQEDSYFVKTQYELQKLLQSLGNQGKYDISLSHHEDGPQSHHEDRARISTHDEKPRKYYHNDRSKYYSSTERIDDHDGALAPNTLLALSEWFKKNSNGLSKYSEKEHNVLDDLSLLPRKPKATEDAGYDNADDVLEFLSDLQKNLADDGKYDQLRCVGNRCGRNRNDDRDYDRADDDRYDRDGLRCRGNNCARSRDGRTNYDDDRNGRDSLRCIGDRCGRNDREDRNNNDRGDRDTLRYRGNKSARSRLYDDNDGDSKILTKKIKLSDDLDAVVLDLSDVDRLLTKLNVENKQTNKVQGAKLLENVDLASLLESRSSNNKKSNVEAVVFDLTQVEDGDVVARQIKRLLSQNNEESEEDYEEYANIIQDHLKRGVIGVDKKAKPNKENSKILAHNENNNNVYVPQWLLNEVISRSNIRGESDSQLLKSMFPLTRQQKERKARALEAKRDKTLPRKIFRRNYEQDVGVPFHLEVQGLGQVSP